MAIHLNKHCSNPDCYNLAVEKLQFSLGAFHVEIPLCEECLETLKFVYFNGLSGVSMK